MPESPLDGAAARALFSNGEVPNKSTLSLGYGTVEKDYQRKFLQGNGAVAGGGGGGDTDKGQLERLLKNSNVNPAKKFIRDANWGPNHIIRAHLWMQLAKRLTSDSDWQHSVQFYRDNLPDAYRKQEGSGQRTIPLPVFCDAAMTNTYHLNDEGRYRCQKVLTMIEANQPAITFAPVLYPVTALLLHFIEDEAQVFACVDALLRPRTVPRRFTGESLHASRSASHTVAELVRRRMKKVYNFILHSIGSTPIDDFFDNWLRWIFVDLPFEVVIRIVDCYLYEGMKVLFRSALAILKIFHRNSGQPASLPNLSASISRYCREWPSHSSSTELLKVGFAFSRLSQEQILLMIRDYEQVIKSAPAADLLNQNSATDLRPRGLEHHRRSLSVPLPFVPAELLQRSRILNQDQLYCLWQWLPLRHRICQPTLLYTSEEHGVSLVTFFQQCGNNEPTLLIVKTKTGDVFGAFCSHSWENRHLGGKNLSYFGTGESFLFALFPEQKIYQWVGLGKEVTPSPSSCLFMAADSNCLIIGGGGGFGIRFDSTLAMGRTETCTTFASPPLSDAPSGDFQCTVVEVFGFAN
ncbi:GTPase-activating protein skywalker-like [Paramacrobiotus metropolitanus]|uniref:GTPase-activating protein skywalker-like n=1 Tax=Paramacrobiotus metropolitanus TaxID=2943436 RepID=UPI002445A3D8|nr:GTPase-activating protein skywalker-like [Paramacrobiotus metropolitanus]